MSRAVLSIGSNLGDRLANLQSAVDAMRTELVAVSPVYETAPEGPVPQDDYLNAVLIVAEPTASPRDWLKRAQATENAAERIRDLRWGPRTLDVDVVSVDEIVSADPELTLPHPRAAERAFVLVPWLAADPSARLGERSVAALLADIDASGVRARDELVLR